MVYEKSLMYHPIKGQYSGHVTCLDQSEASIHLAISESVIQAAGKLLKAEFEVREDDVGIIRVFLMQEVQKMLVSRKMIRILVPIPSQHVLHVLSTLLLCKYVNPRRKS